MGGSAGKLAIGLLILLPAWQGLVLFKQWPLANWLILAVMVLVWAADIGAYFSGKAFGKRKLAPAVSPGKSWEGLIGGLCTSLLITLGVGIFRGWDGGVLLAGLLGAALVVLISVVGDLTESMFKRQSGIRTAATCCLAMVACSTVSTASPPPSRCSPRCCGSPAGAVCEPSATHHRAGSHRFHRPQHPGCHRAPSSAL